MLKDNQIGETNFYSAVGGTPLNNYNYNPSAPACAAGQQYTTACYDPRAEWGNGILDVPHRIIIAPMVELPFGKGKKYATERRRRCDRSAAGPIAFITTWQAGFPLNVQQSNPNSVLGGSTGARPNITSGVDLATTGSYEDRLASADHPAATWINPAAFSTVAFGQFGNTPRTITDLRTPTQFNTDVNFQKNVASGRQQVGAAQARGAEPVQPSDRPRAAGGEHLRRRQRVRSDHAAVGLHADHAVHGAVLASSQTRTQRGTENAEVDQPRRHGDTE